MTTTRKCAVCGAAYSVPYVGSPVRTCSKSCGGKLGWVGKPPGTGYTKVRILGHPLADQHGAVNEHRVVLYAKLGPGSHPCHWCGKLVEWRPVGGDRRGSLMIDHLDGDKRNNDPANLVPSCTGCNSGRGLSNAIQSDELYIVRGGKRLRAERRLCTRCGAEFLHRIAAVSPGLYCSKLCSNRGRRELERANTAHVALLGAGRSTL